MYRCYTSLKSVSPHQQSTWMRYRGCFKCGSTQCICFNFIKVSDSFKSTATRETYNIKQYVTCNSTHVMYLVTCDKYKVQYVGSTAYSFKIRTRRHQSDVKSSFLTRMSAVSAHCVLAHNRDTSSLYFQAIEKVHKPIRYGDYIRKLCGRKAFWIFKLQTCIPKGLNKRSDINLYY